MSIKYEIQSIKHFSWDRQLLYLSNRNSFLRQLCIAAFFAGHRRINERQSADPLLVRQML